MKNLLMIAPAAPRFHLKWFTVAPRVWAINFYDNVEQWPIEPTMPDVHTAHVRRLQPPGWRFSREFLVDSRVSYSEALELLQRDVH